MSQAIQYTQTQNEDCFWEEFTEDTVPIAFAIEGIPTLSLPAVSFSQVVEYYECPLWTCDGCSATGVHDYDDYRGLFIL